MAKQSMAYDHPAYLARHFIGATSAAGASAISGRFAAWAAMTPKAVQVTAVIAGTGTGNATVTLVKIASGGTAITTHTPLIVMSTNAAGYTTNVVCTGGNIAAGDVVYFQNGADATGSWAVSAEFVLVPGADVTA